MKIKLEHDQVDKIIVKELTYMYGNIIKPTWDIHADPEEAKRTADAFSRVLSYYTTKDEYDKIIRKLNKGK
jgi:hypothetical protein